MNVPNDIVRAVCRAYGNDAVEPVMIFPKPPADDGMNYDGGERGVI